MSHCYVFFISFDYIINGISMILLIKIYISVVTILEFLTSIRYLEKYRYSIPFSIPRRKKNCHNIKGVIIYIFFKINITSLEHDNEVYFT